MYKINLILCLLLISILSNGQSKIEFKEIRPPHKSISPAIEKLLLHEISPNEIWNSSEQSGLPIIEVDTLYSDYVWLTFIYQDSTENKEVNFEIFGIYSEYRLGDRKMHRFENSDLYYRSYMIPNDLCFSYRFKIRDTITNNVFYDIDKFNKNLIPTGQRKGFSYSVLDLRSDEPDWNTKVDSSITHQIDTLVFKSKILDNERNVYVYLPKEYANKKAIAFPTIYLFDSFIYMNRIEVPNILDNLISQGKIEPMIAVFIDNPTSTSRKTELPLNPVFKNAITVELIPFLKGKYKITSNPGETLIGGISYGGLAATYISFYHPDIFGKVLSQSGGFWRGIDLTDNFGNEVRSDWLINQFAIEKNKPIKMFLDWGLQENMVLSANRKFVKVLREKGYEFKYIEFNGWHDWANSRKTFSEGLLFLLEK